MLADVLRVVNPEIFLQIRRIFARDAFTLLGTEPKPIGKDRCGIQFQELDSVVLPSEKDWLNI